MVGLLNSDVSELLPEAYSLAASVLHAMMTDQASPYYERPRAGFGRGIEFYRGQQFFHVLAGSIASYASGVGTWPELLDPLLFTEKLLWTKFFQFIPVPAPADRLAMRSFIPPELRDEIRTAKILWQSSEPICPPDSAVPSGQHYVKFSHRSGISRRLQFPLSAQETSTLQHWLHTAFGSPQVPVNGEWWYGAITPAVFVEEAVGGAERPEEWKFFIANGICRFLYHERQRPSGTRMQTLYDRSFNYLPVQIADVEIGQVVQPPDEHERMLAAAKSIGSALNFARIGLYRTKEGEIYLGEITLCPNNAIYRFSDPFFDSSIGQQWMLGTA